MSDPWKPDELAQFASDLQSMRDRALSLRLYEAGQLLASAIQTLGSEIAGHIQGRGKCEAAPNPQTVPIANGRESPYREAKPCPDCGSTEREMRTYGGSLDDADIHCANCGKLIHSAWFPVKVG